MKGLAQCFTVALLVSACVAVPQEPAADALLVEADALLIAQNYKGALVAYAAFATATPAHPQSARVRATHAALERMVAFEFELTRAQRTSELARRESSDRQAESERLRSETERLRSEVTKLRADLERLRTIDLQQIRPEVKK